MSRVNARLENTKSFFGVLKSKHLFALVFASMLVVLLSVSSLAALISDQAADVMLNGVIVSSADLTVFIYDVPVGGSAVYQETFVGAVSVGSWDVTLGESVPLILEYGKTYYKDYSVGTTDLDFLNNSGGTTERKAFVSPMGLVGGEDVSPSANLSLGQRISFGLGQMIDAIVNGWIKITGSLNVTQDLVVGGNVNATGNVKAASFTGDGSGVTNVVAVGINDNTIGTTKLQNESVTNAKIAANAINSSQIIDGVVQNSDLADNSVSTNKILNGTIMGADINSSTTVTISGLNVNGDLNVTGASYFGTQSFTNIDTSGNLKVGGNANITGNLMANSFMGDGSQLSGVGPQQINLTSTKYNGSLSFGGKVGYQAANSICNATFSGSYWCQTNDVILIIKNKDISYFDNAGWQGGDPGAWIANGPPGYTWNANDCVGMKSEANSDYGTFWAFGANGGGSGGLSKCDAKKKLACCRG